MNPLILETWGELKQREVERPEPIVSPLICRASLGLVYGPRGGGKSWLVQQLAYSAASGEDFLKYPVVKPVTVVYADGEMLDWERRRRFQKMDDASVKGKAGDRLHIIRPNFDGGVLPDLETPEGQRLLEELLPVGTELLIVDNLSAWCRSGREDAESWRKVQEWALRMRAKGIAILFVHHANKRGKQRGTSMREDALDYVIALREAPGNISRGISFEMHFEKLRHLPKHKAKPMLLRYRIRKGKPARWVVKAISPDEKVLQVQSLKAQGLNNIEIARRLKVSRATVQRYVKVLKKME